MATVNIVNNVNGANDENSGNGRGEDSKLAIIRIMVVLPRLTFVMYIIIVGRRI
jgi:hypothetical protein